MTRSDTLIIASIAIGSLILSCACDKLNAGVTEAQLAAQSRVQVERWNAAQVSPLRIKEVRGIVDRIERNWDRYGVVSAQTTVPPSVIAAAHNMECSGRFDQHLHNGDSLQRRTWQVPAGRPKTGTPPFKWEYSAVDAVFYDRLDKVEWHDLGRALNALEGYNGWGYFLYHKATPSPYIAGGTSIARPGKYVKDGVWSSTAMSDQIGVIAVWKELDRRGKLHTMTP